MLTEGSRHIVWVDSDPHVGAAQFESAGAKVHLYNETAEALAGFGKEYPVDEKLVCIITSMMRRGGRAEKGLLDGLGMLDTMRFRLQLDGNVSVRPILGVISMTADEQECKDHGVDVLVMGGRTQFMKKILHVLDHDDNRSWRADWRFAAAPQDCERLYQSAKVLQDDLGKEHEKLPGEVRELCPAIFNSTTNKCFCQRCEPKAVWQRGGQKYVLPVGWFRLGTEVRQEYLNRRSEIELWPVAYHGCTRQTVLSILMHVRVMFPGDTLIDGTVLNAAHGQVWADRVAGGGPCIYCSPSINYAGAPPYAKPFPTKSGEAQVVIQLRVKPSAINKFPETLRGKYTDKEFDSKELEWVINDRTAVVPYGLLVRLTGRPNQPGS